jgi:hypothetical protein
MATAERVFWETVVVLIFALLLVVFWFLSGSRTNRDLERAATASAAAAEVTAIEHEASLAALRATCEDWAGRQALSEAEAMFKAFAAGIQPAAAARWGRFLSSTRTALLEQPRVTFVHLMTQGGRVLMSSDEEYTKVGRVDERADWARSLDKLETRPGSNAGILELAGPISDSGRPVGYLWLGYDIEAAKESSRPETLRAIN